MSKPSDSFKFIVPATMEKSEDGSYKVRGLASTESVDQQGETIIQKGIDLTPIDSKKGILNWDHQKGPENTIGLLDGYTRTDNGLYVEGRLFKNHTKAKAVREIMESLGEGDRGRMGLSVEGKILERDPANPSVIRKCRINAVALTMNPVNASTYADMVKSMNASEVEFNSTEEYIQEEHDGEATFTAGQVVQMIEKALGIGAGQAQAPADRKGGDALVQSDMKSKEDEKDKDKDSDKKKEEIKSKIRKMSKSLYKSSMVDILEKLQVLYPECSRSQLWEAVKDRLNTRFPDIESGSDVE